MLVLVLVLQMSAVTGTSPAVWTGSAVRLVSNGRFVFYFSFRMAAVLLRLLLRLLLAAPVLLVSSDPVRGSANRTVPLVLWHGMGESELCGDAGRMFTGNQFE